jgi:hypothetical protein
MTIRKLFSSYRKWIQGTDARVAPPVGASRVLPQSDNAACWCLRGAVIKCYPTKRKRAEVITKLVLSIDALFPKRLMSIAGIYNREDIVIGFNDHRNTRFADVLKVVRHAKV